LVKKVSYRKKFDSLTRVPIQSKDLLIRVAFLSIRNRNKTKVGTLEFRHLILKIFRLELDY